MEEANNIGVAFMRQGQPGQAIPHLVRAMHLAKAASAMVVGNEKGASRITASIDWEDVGNAFCSCPSKGIPLLSSYDRCYSQHPKLDFEIRSSILVLNLASCFDVLSCHSKNGDNGSRVLANKAQQLYLQSLRLLQPASQSSLHHPAEQCFVDLLHLVLYSKLEESLLFVVDEWEGLLQQKVEERSYWKTMPLGVQELFQQFRLQAMLARILSAKVAAAA